MTVNLTINRETVQLSPGADIVLRRQTWRDYEMLLADQGEKSTVKVYFNATTQEIRLMAPSPRRGNRSDALSDLVKGLLRYQGQDWQSFDPITLKKFEEKGVEPDTCFYLSNRQAILGKEKIDLAVDPPPDLALEVDLTSLTRSEDYEGIGVPELWIYRDLTLNIYVFNGQQYVERAESPLFPGILLKNLIPKYVEKAWTEGVSVAVRDFERELVAL